MKLFKIYFSILIVFSPTLLFGQKTWTFKDNTHIFIVTVDTVLCGGTEGNKCPTIKKVDIYSAINNEQIQTIIPEQFLFDNYLDSSTVCGIEDMNFDGKNDIRLLNWTSTNLQKTYWYWFYNESSKKFQRDTTLDEIRNPYFDQSNKTIHTWWRDASSDYGHALYKWQEKKLVLIAEEEETWNLPDHPGIYTTRRMVNGVIKEQDMVVKEHIINYLHQPGQCNLNQ